LAATVVFNGTNVTEAENTTNWNNDTISAAESWSEIKIQYNGSVGYQANNKDGYGWYDYSGTGSFNFSTTHAGQHVFIWVNITTPGILDTVANNGLYLMVGDSDTTFNCYTVGGGNALDRYNGGWKRFVLDPRKTPTFTIGGGASISSISRFGVGVNTTGASRADNLFIDRIDVGWGLRIYGTSTDGWADVVSADMNTSTNVYGILQERDGIYYAFGRLEIGDDQSTNGTTFSDTDRVIRWVSQEYYYSGGWVDIIGDDFFRLDIVSNSTNATSFTDGIQVGTGDTSRGRNGTTFLGSSSHTTTISLDDGNNSSNTLNLYGTTLRYMGGGISANGDSDHRVYGCVVDQCGIFDPGGTISIRNTTFSNTTDNGYSGSSFYWTPTGVDIKNSFFIANTHATYDPHGILHTASGIYQYDNLKFAGNDYDIAFSGASASDWLTIQSIDNSSDPGTVDVIVGSGYSIDNAVYLTIDVEDILGVPISGAAVAIYTASGGVVQLMNEYTNPAGRAQESYNYLGAMPISIRIRKSSAGDTRYYPIDTTGEIGSAGFSLTAIMTEDTIVI